MTEIPEDEFFENMGAEAVEETQFDPTVQFFASNWLARQKHAQLLIEQNGYSATLRREASIAAWTAAAWAAAALIVVGLVIAALVMVVIRRFA